MIDLDAWAQGFFSMEARALFQPGTRAFGCKFFPFCFFLEQEPLPEKAERGILFL